MGAIFPAQLDFRFLLNNVLYNQYTIATFFYVAVQGGISRTVNLYTGRVSTREDDLHLPILTSIKLKTFLSEEFHTYINYFRIIKDALILQDLL
jgi:hypothetical protein